MHGNNQSGLTQIELIIALALSCIVITAACRCYTGFQQFNLRQIDILQMQMDSKMTINHITNQLFFAGSRLGVNGAFSKPLPDTLRFRSLASTPGPCASNDTMSHIYYLDKGNNFVYETRCNDKINGISFIAGGMDSVLFTYYDSRGHITSQPNQIRTVAFKLTFCKRRKHDASPIYREIAARVSPRNLLI